MTLQIEQVASAVFDGSGVATATFPAVPIYTRWTVTRVAVSTTSATRTAVSVYRNSAAAPNLIDTDPYGGNGNSTDTVSELAASETLVVQWTGGTPGAVATATMSGTQSAGN